MAREMDRYEIKLAFTADNRQAISQIQQLEKSLKEVSKMPFAADAPFKSLGLEEASNAAVKLQQHLKNALNVNTGRLDLSRLSTSLKSANESLDQYYKNLMKAGTAGQKAFMDLASAISSADVPVLRMSQRMQDFSKTLKNTVKWQISSNITHGLERAISSAYNYAKNLNSSLNDIRIVTGHNIEYMDKFARKANAAAKALSSTTLDYTNSALTYYQQGLDDKQVEARTAITLKMANASGVAAETVAEQLTAVWNNFSKGADDLEHFADAMVRLGADTASSTDEISDGLQKFSAIANTIGLSFDNAAAALATITATTRESADSVGTALRTLFARIQGLNLGETLDDGTTLNKYSEALNKVGINIKDQAGNLKEMDTILDEMGSRWKTLANDEQVALAQVVGGVRQYQYVMNLMNNFDFYQENVSRAQNADGSLQEQADIYAEGWRAASKEVKASLESIYDSLINDEFFIDLAHFISTLLDGIDSLVKGFGGLGGVLTTIGSIALRVYAKEMPNALRTLKDNLLVLTGQSKTLMEQTNQTMNEKLMEIQNDPMTSESTKAKATILTQLNTMQEKLVSSSHLMSQAEQNEYKQRMENVSLLGDEIIKLTEKIEKLKEINKLSTQNLIAGNTKSFRETEAKYQANKASLAENDEQTKAVRREYQANERQKAKYEARAKELSKLAGTAKGQVTQAENELQRINEQLADPSLSKENETNLKKRKSKVSLKLKNKKAIAKPLLDEQKENEKNSAALDKRNAELSAQIEELSGKREGLEGIQSELRQRLDAVVKQIYNDGRATYESRTKGGGIISNEQLSTVINDSVNGYKKIITAQQTAVKQGEGLARKMQDLSKESLSDLDPSKNDSDAKRFEELRTSTQQYLKSMWGSLKEDPSFKDYSEDVQKQISSQIKEVYDSSQMLNEGTTAPENLTKAVERAQQAIANLIQIMGEGGNASASMTQKLQQLFGPENQQQAEEVAQTVREIAQAEAEKQSFQQKNKDNAGRNPEHKGSASEYGSYYISGLMSGVQAFENLKNTIKSINDETTSVGDAISGLISTLFLGVHAVSTFGTALKGLMASLGGPATLAIVAVTAGIMALIAAIKKIQANSPEAQLKKAKERLEELRTATDSAKTAVDSLKEAFDGYNSVKDKLDGCVKGTKEWEEALTEVNQKVIEILNNYPGLSDYVEQNPLTGELYLSQKGQEEYLNQMQKTYLATQRAYNRQALQVQKKNFEIQTNKARNEMSDFVNSLNARDLNDENKYTAQQKREKHSSGDNGDLKGMRTATNKYFNLLDANYKEYSEKMANYAGSTSDFIKNEIIGSNNALSSLNKMADSTFETLISLTSEFFQNRETFYTKYQNYERIQNTQYAEDILKGNSVYENSDYQQYLREIVTNTLSEVEEEVRAISFDEKDKDKLLSFYKEKNASARGYSYVWDTNQKGFVYGDGQLLTLETLAEYSYQAEVQRIYDEAISGYNQLLTTLFSSGEDSDKAMAKYVSSQDFSNFLADDFENLFGEGGLNFGRWANQDTLSIIAKILGKDSAELSNEIYNAGKDLANNFNNAFVKNLFSNNDITYSAAGSMDKFLGTQIEEGKNVYLNIANRFQKAIKDLSKEDKASAWNQFAFISWDSFDAGKQAKQILDDFGISIKSLGEDWDRLVIKMLALQDVDLGLNKLRETLESIDKIVKDIKIGSIIDNESYTTLMAFNKELEKYFTMLSDGSAQFTGSIFDFNSDYEDAKITEYEDRIKVVNQQIDKIKQDERLYEAGLATGRTKENVNQPDSDKLNQKTGESQLAQNELALMVQDTDRAEELYRQGILNYTAMSERANAKQNELYASNLDASEVEQYSDYLQDLADSENDVAINGVKLSKELKNNDSAARKVAASAKLTQKGIDSLASNFEDWKDILKTTEKGTTTYAHTIGELKTAASLLLNVNKEFISDDFLVNPENMANFEKAAKGDTDAIWALREALAKDFILNLDIDQESKDSFLASLNSLLTEIPTIEIGAEINDENFKKKIAEILQESKMTAEQANAFLSTMGLHMEIPKVEAGYVETKDELMNTITDTQTIDMGNGYVSGSDGGDIKDGSHRYAPPIIRTVSTSWQEPSGKYRTTRIPVYMKDGKPNFKLTRTDGGTLAGPSTSGPKGGKSSKPSKTSKTKKSDTVERYKEITDKINNLTRAYDNAAKAADRLYGKDRVKAIEENNKRLKQEIELLKQKAKEAKNYLVEEDRPALNKAAAALGVKFKIENDNIINYRQEMEKVYKTLSQMEDKVNAFKNADAQNKYKENTYEPYKEKVDELKAAISQWEETRDLILNLQDEQMEKFYEWQDQNLEVLNYKLEVKITINENDLKWLEHYFNALSDNIYKAAEAFGYLQTQVEPTGKMLAAQKEIIEGLDQALAAGEISIAGYVESMQDAYNSILSNIEALQDLDKQMVEYYGNTLDLAEEELSKYTDQMEHLTNVLDHYQSIMQLLGKETDYDSMGVLLGGVADVKRNNYLVSKEWFQTLKAQQAEAAAALANAGSELEREALQKNFDAISEKVREAEEKMLSDAEEYGQAIQEIWVNKTTQAADLMNKALTDGMGWDALNDSMSRMSSYQDEYLTKTNQVYEMNKMLNTVSQAIDKTNNQAAKNRYNQFSKEIEQLKDKDKLSQLELEIAQAKYKILEAQIALEEAQNAKSVVRLQRDSEGNFGYVYTADQDKINNAEQQLADAENDLYNIRLNATNKYGQQKLKYEQELAEKLAEVDQRANEDAIYREGEYQNERKRIQEEYQALINASNELYKIGQQEDARVIQDAWVNSYDYIIDKGDEWQGAIKDYTDSVNEAFREWEANTDILTDLVGKDLDEVTDKVGDVVWASEQLRDKVVDDVIPGLEVELTAVRSLTEGWAQHRDELYENIRAYEELAKYAMDQIAEKSGYSGFDMDADYSTLMANSVYGSREYEQYKAYRQQKLNKMEAMGMDTSTMASNEQLDNLFALSARESGWKLGSDALANYSSYNEIPDYIWDLITQMLARKMSGFASGGYTGEWDGDNGKLAILHQKELVLNANDTNNLLNAVSIIRSIGTVIDRMAAFSGLSSLVSAAPQGMSAQGLDQSVVINAEFPNATDRNEIVEAFNSLINRASQFANRKNI